jgi:hypothetical protein
MFQQLDPSVDRIDRTAPKGHMPHDLYPKADLADTRSGDVFAEGMVQTHRDSARLPLRDITDLIQPTPRVLDATPHLLVATELLYTIAGVGFSDPRAREICMRPWRDWTALQAPKELVETHPHDFDSWERLRKDGAFTGWLLRLTGSNKTLVYRIGRFRARTDSYECSWAD